jgi:hypothetical protein
MDSDKITKQKLEEAMSSDPQFAGMKIVIDAPLDSPYVDQVLQAIGYPEAYVTEGSMVGDFPLGVEDLKPIQEKLGVPVSLHDYVLDVAKRVKEAIEAN